MRKMNFLYGVVFLFNLGSVLPYLYEDLDFNGIEMEFFRTSKMHNKPAIDEYYGDIFMPYLFDSGVGNRDTVMINDISVDESFSYGDGVIDWRAINFGGTQYLVGRREQSIILIQIKIKHFTSEKFNTLFFNETVMEFEGTIGPVVLITHINFSLGLEEGFALVTESTNNHFQSIHWLKMTNKELVLFDTWSNPTRGEIIDLKWIKFDFIEYMLIITKDKNNFTTIDISHYKLQDNNKQSLRCLDKVRVEYTVGSVSIVVQGEDLHMILVAPEQEKVWLYLYHLNFNQVGGFKLLFDISSRGVTASTTFIQSGRNYFLLNGDEPNIYLLNQNKTLSSQLHNSGRVDEWLVLQVPTYREDVILLARQQKGLSLLTWSGSLKGFTLSEQPPCFNLYSSFVKQTRISDDASCLSRCGWSGGAVLNLGHFPSLILSCNHSNSDLGSYRVGGLYYFNVSLHPVHGPAEDVIQILSHSQQLSEKVINLSRKFEDEGLMEEVTVSRSLLMEGYRGEWSGLEHCLHELENKVSVLSSYVELRHQNNLLVEMSLQHGKLVGSAFGLLGNQSVQSTFNGKFGLQADGKPDRAIFIDSDVTLDKNQRFAVKAKMNLEVLEVDEIPPAEEVSIQSSYGLTPEIQGPPQSAKSQVFNLKIEDMLFKNEEIKIPVPWGHVAGVVWSSYLYQGEKKLLPVLCFHGLKENANAFLSLIRILPNNRKYICIDLPGHGQSSHFPDGLPYDIMHLLLSIRIVVSQLQLSKFIMLGHSLGAGLCVTYAATYPEMVEKLLIIDSGPFITPSEGTVKHIRRSADQYLNFLNNRKASPIFSSFEESCLHLHNTYKESNGRLGANDIGENSVRNLLKRGLQTTSSGYRYTNDPRLDLLMVKQPLYSIEQSQNVLEAVRCPCIMIVSSFFVNGATAAFGEAFFDALFGYAESLNHKLNRVEGPHSVHMSHPERVASVFREHLETDEPLPSYKSKL